MKKSTLKLSVATLLGVLSLGSGVASAEEYVHRDVMGNTLPSPRCLEKSVAAANASDAYTVKKKEKVFCETQGYGWHVAEEKSNGKLVCEACGGERDAGKYQCHLEDIVVACKRLKPGAVGLVPGKG